MCKKVNNAYKIVKSKRSFMTQPLIARDCDITTCWTYQVRSAETVQPFPGIGQELMCTTSEPESMGNQWHHKGCFDGRIGNNKYCMQSIRNC